MRRWSLRSRALIVAVGVLACLPVAATTGTERDHDEILLPDLSEAQPQVRRKILEARDAVVGDSNNAEAWGRLAKILHAHRCITAAQAAYVEARRLEPTDFRWSYFHGALIRSVYPGRAMPLLQAAVDLDPSYAPARVRLGRVYEALAMFDEAWTEYGLAVRIDPRNGSAHMYYGMMALQRDLIPQAVTELESAVHLRPGDVAALSSLARAYQRAGDVQRARDTALAARNAKPQSPIDDPRLAEVGKEAINLRAIIDRAQRLQEVGMLDEALAELLKGLEHAPDDSLLHVALTDVYLRRKEFDRAAAAARRALATGIEIQGLHKSLAIALFELERFDESDQEAKLALKQTPNDADVHQIRGQILARKEQVPEAIYHLQQSLRAKPHDQAARFLLGKLFVQQGQFARAAEHLQHVVRALPSDVEAWSLLAICYLQLKQHDRAVEAFEKALVLSPVNPALTRGLSAALIALGRNGEAAKHLRATLAKRPRAVLIANDLAWLLATCREASVRNGAEALEIAQRVTDNFQARRPSTLDTLAAAYAELARFDEAVRTMQEVIRLAAEANMPPARLAKYQQRLELYRSGRPYRSGGE